MGRSKLKFTRSIMAGMSFLFGFCWSHDKIYILLLVVKQLTSSALPLLLIFIPKYILDLLTEAMPPRYRAYIYPYTLRHLSCGSLI